ncbi:MAG: hypothetical protein MI741_02195 [Rhodospirillales bacterium]|nr:hypothetical protein [Rhodospirillales bacterium]
MKKRTNPDIRIVSINPHFGRPPKTGLDRLAEAVAEMNANVQIQRRKVHAFQRTMTSLEERLESTAQNLRSYQANLAKINVAGLGKRARRLAFLMSCYETRAQD